MRHPVDILTEINAFHARTEGAPSFTSAGPAHGAAPAPERFQNQPNPTPMNKRLPSSIAMTLGLIAMLTQGSVQAGQPLFGPTGKEAQPIVIEESAYQLQPIFTRHGHISEKFTLSTTVRGSRDVELQEAENFDSWGIDVEAVLPLFKRFQLRLNVPVYTNGHARLLPIPVVHRSGRVTIQNVENIRMSGYGGVFDFASVQLEGQFLTQEQHGVNMIASIGIARRIDPLHTNSVGLYNHAGEYYMGQIRADRKVNDWLTLVGHAGFRHYYISDDLNPAGQLDGNVFTHAEGFLAGVFDPWKSNIFPVLEIAFTGDLHKYNSVLIVPEIIWAVNTHLELKAAATIGACDDGERLGFRVQGVLRF